MHHEPDVALRFEEIAADADDRARLLDDIAAHPKVRLPRDAPAGD
jgi:hypothetical protein